MNTAEPFGAAAAQRARAYLDAGGEAIDADFRERVRTAAAVRRGERPDSAGEVPERLPQGIGQLLQQRSRLMDEVLIGLWHAAFASLPVGADTDSECALVAVGGYGRDMLHPHSDVDLLVLLEDTAHVPEQALEAFVTGLWDLGRTIGHSVRTVSECVEAAAGDLTIMTAVLEARTLCGNPELLQQTMLGLDAGGHWDSAAFFRAKLDEQSKRHARFDNVGFNLEPNVKSSPGGLRDLQTVGWIAMRRYGSSDPATLAASGILTNREANELTAGLEFLGTIRYAMHMLAGREEDRLHIDLQRQLADQLGYVDGPRQLGVESFMHDYFRHTMMIEGVTDVVLQHVDESLSDPESTEVEPIDMDFRRVNDCVEVIDEGLFRRQPAALMRMFVVLANEPRVSRVGARTIRLLRESVELIDDAFRNDREITASFLELLRAPERLVTQLMRLRRWGLLQRYIPEFGQVTGQMQHDLFHAYTVDTHTLQVIRQLRRFLIEDLEETYPVATHCMRKLPRPELIYIAALFHDIAKGRGGDHSTLGALDVGDFCDRHRLSAEDRELVAWLVRDHLLMSHVAQRQDVDNPEVIAEFARRVGSQDRLDHLYALTAADITATNPTLWNSWRASLLRRLYNEAKKFYRRDAEPDVARTIADRRAELAERVEQREVPAARVAALLASLPDDYFLARDPSDAAWELAEVALNEAPLPLVRVRDPAQHSDRAERATEILVHCEDGPNVFAACVAALSQLNLDVLGASLSTTAGGLCIDGFHVLDAHGAAVRDPAISAEVEARLTEVLRPPVEIPAPARRRIPRSLRQFELPTRVTWEPADGDRQELSISAADRPGLLALIGAEIGAAGLSIQSARIATLGERVDDRFLVSSANGEPLDEARRRRIARSIASAVTERLQDTR